MAAVLSALPPLAFLLTTSLILSRGQFTLASLSDKATLDSLMVIGIAGACGIAAGLAVRLLIPRAALFPDEKSLHRRLLSGPIGEQAGQPVRDRLARNVVVGGTFVIGLTAVVLMAALAFRKEPNWETTALSIFTSVLPVFSTWVGTVLAFYFTNESFRQAAQSTQSLTDRTETEPITRPGTMIPYERVIRIELTTDEVGDKDPQLAAAQIDLARVNDYFKPPGVVRVILFDNKKRPVFVLRHEFMPTIETGDKLEKYLNSGTNKAIARNFSWTARTATIQDGRRLLETRRVTDLFVTEHGRADEPVIGWVPDDNLKTPN